MPFIRRLSGQQQTPVLVWDDQVIAGSGAIVNALDVRIPDPPLMPADAASRIEVEVLCNRFDQEVGPAVRTALFSVMIHHGDYLCRVFAGRKPWPKRLAYRASYPLARGLIARGNGVVDPENVRRSFDITRRALDEVAERAAATGQLVGSTFTAADLTAAALLAPLVNPAHPDMARPEPMPGPIRDFVASWAAHPGARWVLTQYARYRS
jgi:glutathione S-transferase